MKRSYLLTLGLAMFGAALSLRAQTLSPQSMPQAKTRVVIIARGWAGNQINAVIFRRNSVTSHGPTQYVAFYDSDARVVLARRDLASDKWEIYRTQYSGDVSDAHKSISIAVDGDGFLHLAWNQHNTPLQYCRAIKPGSLELSPELPLLGRKEDRVTYPEFYNLRDGNLLFLYRDGASGNGNLILNRYDRKTKRWARLQDELLSGEGERNAYWQMAVDARGAMHLSWIWRETPDVATNHDLCYARSTDGGKSWTKSSGEKYQLPITARTAEYVVRIPPGSELINQTSMSVDAEGRPYIATYWRPAGTTVPQYHLVSHDGHQWRTSQITHRTTSFSLSGQGTRRIPISRPLIVVRRSGDRNEVIVIFRDIERGDRVSAAVSTSLEGGSWSLGDLTEQSVGMWEPTYDSVVWNKKSELHLFVQTVGQGEAEGIENIPPQMISILEWRPPSQQQ